MWPDHATQARFVNTATLSNRTDLSTQLWCFKVLSHIYHSCDLCTMWYSFTLLALKAACQFDQYHATRCRKSSEATLWRRCVYCFIVTDSSIKTISATFDIYPQLCFFFVLSLDVWVASVEILNQHLLLWCRHFWSCWFKLQLFLNLRYIDIIWQL